MSWYLHTIVSKIYWKQGSHIFLLFGTCTLVLFPNVWIEPKFLLLILTWQLSRLIICISTGFCTLLTKTLFLFRISLLRYFIYEIVKRSQILLGATILVTPTNNQVKAASICFDQEKVSFLSSYLRPTQKINHAYLTDSEYSLSLLMKRLRPQRKSQSGYLLACKTFGFIF